MKIMQWDERGVRVTSTAPTTPPRTLAEWVVWRCEEDGRIEQALAEWRAERAEAAAAKFERDANGLTQH